MFGTRGRSQRAKRCKTLAVSWPHRKSGSDSGTSERLRAHEYASKNCDVPHENKNDSWPETSRNLYRDDGEGSSRPQTKSAKISWKF
ncbi:hypothetical protein CY34DRAFT_813269 [Suillus luteus UH-Slu-Lm8-n1]|uniref:Uncharacterized protein n=1 Tax=Suillus luteus UH-Slu-Lm8-n1 TaxID=930992 RepID=A0A0D0A6Y3_9AGAM|nr:hypothetical protein CY34DRAFT_813269 [Suillus luteus UH-Slu-Lm8-n1]